MQAIHRHPLERTMKAMTPSSRRRLPAPLLCLAALALALALAGCNGGTTTGPLPGPPPETGPVLGGSVRNVGGRPVGGVVVLAEPFVDGVAASVRARLDAQAAGPDAPVDAEAKAGAARRAAVTDERGRFAFAGLEPGQWLLTTEARDHKAGRATATVPEPRASALAETTFVDIALIPTGTFRGGVTLQNATNHQSTVVYCEGTSYVAVTDAAGDFSMTDVPAGAYTLIGTHSGWLDRSTNGTLTAAGDFSMTDVPAGAYTLIGTHSGWLDRSTNGTLTAAGETVEVAALVLPRDNNMPPAVTITTPAPGINVPQELAQFAATASDPDGTIALYEWDFDDDGAFETSSTTSGSASYSWPTTGTFRAKVRVTDNRGAIAP
ncbi:PKD domain-containing protein, partial [bacterium]|nr:PKD domain-containing protein [bacterium]